jgi:hypothetical protein
VIRRRINESGFNPCTSLTEKRNIVGPHWFNADLDLSFLLPGSRETNQYRSMRIRNRILLTKNKKIFMNPLKKVIRQKTYLQRYKKTFLIAGNQGLFVNFGQYSCSWIRIRIPNKEPDPGQHVTAPWQRRLRQLLCWRPSCSNSRRSPPVQGPFLNQSTNQFLTAVQKEQKLYFKCNRKFNFKKQ